MDLEGLRRDTHHLSIDMASDTVLAPTPTQHGGFVAGEAHARPPRPLHCANPHHQWGREDFRSRPRHQHRPATGISRGIGPEWRLSMASCPPEPVKITEGAHHIPPLSTSGEYIYGVVVHTGPIHWQVVLTGQRGAVTPIPGDETLRSTFFLTDQSGHC